MAEDPDQAFLRELLNAAKVYDPAAGCKEPHGDPTQSCGQSAYADPAAVADGVAVLTFLIETGALNLGDYVTWNRSAIAFKNTFGEPGFSAWLGLSAAADNFDGEERCRQEWDNIKVRNEDAQRLTIATYFAQANELGWKPKARTDQASGKQRAAAPSKDSPTGLPKNVDPAAFAVHLVDETADEFWLNQADKPHVSYEVQLPDGRSVLRHARVASSDYKLVLASRFFEATGNKVLTSEQANQAAAILEFRARESGVHHTTAVRAGDFESKIYVDLGAADGRAVEIDSDGWRVVESPPVRFIRGSRGELPEPLPGGRRDDFKRHFNVNEDDLTRVIGFMIGALNVGASYSILLTDGPQGSGKSMLNDKVVSLIDPPRQSKGARMSFNSKEEDLHLGALGVHLIYFDNVSTFSAEAADALCRLSTGGGSGRRKLYSNDQYIELVVIRPIIITCIGSPTSRPDLLSRSVRITALGLGENRRTERAVMRAFEADRPRMIGFIFTCVAAALRNRAAVEDAVERGDFQLPRMADFAEFVEGASELLGLPLGGFSKLLDEGQSAMQIEAVLGHPVGAGLLKLLSTNGLCRIEGSARVILDRLRDALPSERRWPAANTFRKTLSRLSVGLQSLGVEWEVSAPRGHDNVAMFKIWATDRFNSESANLAAEHRRDPF